MKYLDSSKFEHLVSDYVARTRKLGYNCHFCRFSIDGSLKYLVVTSDGDIISSAVIRAIPERLSFCVSSDGLRATLNIFPIIS